MCLIEDDLWSTTCVCVFFFIHSEDMVTFGVWPMALILGGLYMYILSFITDLMYDKER
jgi:hypothetical protein